MSLFGNVKEKLGFGEQPEWQDDYYAAAYDEEPDSDGYIEEPYEDEGVAGVPAGASSGQGSLLSFDDYNPSNFGHVTLSGDHDLKVASYGDDTRGSYFDRKASGGTGYGSNIGTSSRRATDKVRSFNDRPSSERDSAMLGASWDTPADPAFLDDPAPKYNRDIHDPSPYLPSDRRRKDPAQHIEIIRPSSYGDVERVANGAKAGRLVVLVLKSTRPELAKRILDFSFGVVSALNGSVDKMADRVYVIAKGNDSVTDEDTEYLRKQGVL